MDKEHIEVEQMLFGDFRVQVCDERKESLLDREYFCRGYDSAIETAKLVKKDLFPELPIYKIVGEEVTKIVG